MPRTVNYHLAAILFTLPRQLSLLVTKIDSYLHLITLSFRNLCAKSLYPPNHIPVQQQPTSPSSAVALSLECVVSLLLSLHTLFTKLLSSCPPTIIINSRETNAERIQNCWHLNKRRTKLTRYNIIINTPSHTPSTVTSSAFSCLFADLLYWMEILR